VGARGRAPARPLSARARSRPRRAARRRRRFDPARALAGFVAVACLATLAACVYGPYFVIREIAVAGTHHVAVDLVVSTAALTQTPLFVASATRARARLLRLPAVRDARVDLTLPDRARISLTERVALGRWIAAGREWFVDAEGVLFASTDARAAPEQRVTDEGGARQAGDRLDPALVNAAMQLARLGPDDLRPDATSPRVLLTGNVNGLVLRTAAGWEIRFGGPEGIGEKIALARRFLRENQQRKIDYVDVRTADSLVVSPR